MALKKLRRGLTNVSLLTVPSEDSAVVDGEVTAKTDREQVQKKTEDGTLQWTVEVVIPNGRGSISQRVTINADRRPDLVDGDIVVFENLVAGAFADGRNAVLYFSADGVKKLGHMDDDGERRYDTGVMDQLDSILAE